MEGPDRRVRIEGLDLGRVIPAANLPGAACTAMRPERLAIAVFMVLLLVAIGRSWDAAMDAHLTPAQLGLVAETDGQVLGDFEATVRSVHASLGTMASGVIDLDPTRLSRGGVGLLYRLPMVLFEGARPFLVVYGIVCAFVFGIGGAAIARLEGERFARDREVTVGAAIGWALKSWQRFVGAIMLPPVLALVMLAIPAVLGVVALVPGLDVLVAVIWGVGLFFGLASALLIIGWLVSLPLVVAAAACDLGDPGEIVVRVAGFAWRRPFSLLFLAFSAVVVGVVGWLAVAGLVAVALDTSRAAGTIFGTIPFEQMPTTSWPTLATVGSATLSEDVGGTTRTATAIVDLWRMFALSLAYGWLVSFFFSVGARVYLLQRTSVEGLERGELGEPGP
jgi:hypothetical protein